MIKTKNFGAVNELKIETGELKITGAAANNCHAELVSASGQYGVNANFQTKKTLKAEKADGIYAGKREPKSRQRSEVMTGASAKLFQERVQGDSEWDAKGNGKLKINGIKHPNIFNSKKRYGFTLDEDTEIISEDVSLSPRAGSKIASADVNLSPLRGKYPPEAGERGLKRGCQGLKRGFTLAEVLITLVVIGVVAAITIPVLHSNTGGKEWNAAKQKARAGLGEAFKLASLNQDLPDISAKEYIKTVLPKYLKMEKTCDTPQECGFADYIKTPEGGSIPVSNLSSWDTITPSNYNSLKEGNKAKDCTAAEGGYKDAPYKDAGYFRTVDGFSVSLLYNPQCRASDIDNNWYKDEATGEKNYQKYGIAVNSSYGAVCFNAVYDMNGSKGPNTVGKDVGFAGSFYSGINARSAAVLPVHSDKYIFNNAPSFEKTSEYCKSLGAEYDLPTTDENSLIFLNNTFVGNPASFFWSRSGVPGSKSQAQRIAFYNGVRSNVSRTYSDTRARCVRADKLM